ncbi:MAG: anthranilate synthase component I family protein [Planctomycetota bacterium]
MSAVCRLVGGGWGGDIAGTPDWTVRSMGDLDPRDPFADIRHACASGATHVGYVSYSVRTLLEPSGSALARDGAPATDDRGAPALAMARLDEAHDTAPGGAYAVGGFTSATGRDAYERQVARCVGLIHAGDCFQANLAHRLSAPFEGHARGLADALFGRTRPDFGALLELPTRTIVSVSPELFVSYDARTRRVVTEPIKGTRPAELPASELAGAEKDTAELAMITDLMRNDLGRVAAPGSVRVEHERALRAHAGALGVRHASSTVSCTLAPGLDAADLLTHTFPPGSVTGAPKVRAMQIIDALEPVMRHAYCGCIFLSCPDGSVTASVAIRTLTIDHERGVIDLPVGAGIVADSDPPSEWEETLTKSRAIIDAIRDGATLTPETGVPRA